MTTLRSRDGGSVSTWSAVLSVVAVVLALAVVALAQVQAARTRAAGVAAEAARAGVQYIDLAVYRSTGELVVVPDQAAAAAHRYLAGAGATGRVDVEGPQVTVTSTSRQRVPLLAVFGISDVEITATAVARPYTADPIGGP